MLYDYPKYNREGGLEGSRGVGFDPEQRRRERK